MSVKVYNTLTRKKEEFKPVRADEVRMYVCGPTVYDLSHIGHARSAVSFDVIYRYLKYRGFSVIYTRNYTDVDDKIIKRAQEEGVSSGELSERYIKTFDEDMANLGVELPTHRPRATETIETIIGLVGALIERGFAYVVDGDVYFSVRKFEGYGKLSGKRIEELEAGARVEVDKRKADPLDFALWKSSKPGEPSWESPWGKGRPGWHIECSAMCLAWLGITIDIHGGGKDLIFPHHENELAQSEAATGKEFIRYWLHNGFVNIDREKMSKSLGNILNIRDVLKAYTNEAVRLFLLSSHYRSPIDYTRDSLKEAEAAVERFYRTIKRMEDDWPDVTVAEVDEGRKRELMEPVIDAMDDDFNTAAAIGRIFEETNRANRLMDEAGATGAKDKLKEELPPVMAVFKEAGRFLGIFHRTPREYFDDVRGRVGVPAEEIERLIFERDEARKSKDFKRADAIRDGLKKRGIILEDTPKGTVWYPSG
jgi:cysteinyl-tRNA synthetase